MSKKEKKKTSQALVPQNPISKTVLSLLCLQPQIFLTIHQAMFPTKNKTCKKNRMLTPRTSHKNARNKQ
jgi:hypothetical protein